MNSKTQVTQTKLCFGIYTHNPETHMQCNFDSLECYIIYSNKAKQSKAKQSKAKQSKTKQSKTKQSKAKQSKAKQTET